MLVDERDRWREAFDEGMFSSTLYDNYKSFRNDNHKRMSSSVEYLCEYILHLEKVNSYYCEYIIRLEDKANEGI